jgi:ATP-dependent HslUV protease subunit HslV
MFQSTTIICIRHKGKVALAGDGQVTIGDTVVKQGAKKIRKLYNQKMLAGFAGSAADGMALFAKFEAKLEEFRGNLRRASVELAKEWRTDRILRRLEALLIVADQENSYLISGSGDLIEPDDGILAIGSGGPFAMAAARALLQCSQLSAPEIAVEAMKIAAGICIYTNTNIVVEEL